MSKLQRAVPAVLSTVLLASLPVGLTSTGVPVAMQAQAQENVSISVFFEPLAQHGRWVHTRGVYCWIPTGVSSDWRPYTRGHWEYTRRHGWLWVSDEPWGWATYHYGRWGYDEANGWYWVPGTRWGPAWVSWRRSDDYVGWAPLPPSGPGYVFSASIGNVTIGVGAWRFVETRYFLEPELRTRLVRYDRVPDVYRRTQKIGTVRVQNNIVVNNVIQVSTIERQTKKQVRVREIEDAKQPGVKVSGDKISAYRPKLEERKPKQGPRNAEEVKELRDRTAKVEPDAPAQGRRGKQGPGDKQSTGERPALKPQPDNADQRRPNAGQSSEAKPDAGAAQGPARDNPRGEGNTRRDRMNTEPRARSDREGGTARGKADRQEQKADRPEQQSRRAPADREQPQGRGEQANQERPRPSRAADGDSNQRSPRANDARSNRPERSSRQETRQDKGPPDRARGKGNEQRESGTPGRSKNPS